MKQILEFLESFVVMALVLAGLAGISYHMFRDGGWMESILGNIWNFQAKYPLIALPVLVGAIILGIMWRNHRLATGHVGKLPTLLLYLLMAAGAYFIGHYAIRGEL